MFGYFSSAPAAPVEQQSLLEGWKAYESNGGGDPEAGVPLLSASAITGRIGSLAGDAATKIRTTVTDVKASASAVVPSANSFQLALGLFMAGACMQFIAVFIALPVIVLSPTKFAVRRAAVRLWQRLTALLTPPPALRWAIASSSQAPARLRDCGRAWPTSSQQVALLWPQASSPRRC